MDFKNSSFTILGAGRSGIAVSRLLKRHGAKVFLSDDNERIRLKFLDENILKSEDIEYELGRHSDKVFTSDVIIKSPGIPPGNEIVKKARALNKKIYSEIEAAYWFCKYPIIAVTGTNGKTTTTVLTGEIFTNAGYEAKVCGNVGLAFSEVVDSLKKNSIVVLEVSSFQLEDIKSFKPEVAVLLNISSDHLDWHGDFESYVNSKLKILNNQTEEDFAVINYDDPVLTGLQDKKSFRKIYFSIKEQLQGIADAGCYLKGTKIIYFDKTKNIEEEIMETGDINIRGNHNLYNSLASIISARIFDIKRELIKETLEKFPGVEHRIEFIKEVNGVSYYNDSKATNIDSLIVALESFSGNLILILGGRESGNDYSRVDELIGKKVKEIIALGEAKGKISRHFEKHKNVTLVSSLEEAVQESIEKSRKGDIVLLSPACKSFDMFENFEHRGNEFKRIVNKLN